MIVQSKWFLTAWILTVCSSIPAADEPKPANPVAGPAVGELFPAFESTDDKGLPWKSSNHVGKKVLVLYFYPGDFTGGCTKQARLHLCVELKQRMRGEAVDISNQNPVARIFRPLARQ